MPLQHAQWDAQHPQYARHAISQLVETLAGHGSNLREAQAAAATTVAAGGTKAEHTHCTAYIKISEMFAKCIMQKGSACGDTMQFPY